jgi:hypothetical protein
MTPDAIRDAKRAPFVPFDLVLADRTIYTITHPDFIGIAPQPRAREVVIYMDDDTSPDGYRTRTINLGLVAELVRPSVVAMNRGTDYGGNGEGA